MGGVCWMFCSACMRNKWEETRAKVLDLSGATYKISEEQCPLPIAATFRLFCILPMASKAGSPSHSRALKKLRPSLIKELPEPAELMDTPELRSRFSGYERSHIKAPSLLSQRAEKFLEVVELAPREVFELFIIVLRRMNPDLARRLCDTWKKVEEFPEPSSSPPQSSGGSNGAQCECEFFFNVTLHSHNNTLLLNLPWWAGN